MKRTFRFLPLAILSVFALACPDPSHAANVLEGAVIEFTSPDDLLLDPATVMIAVDVNGAGDVEVNGVTFQTDGQGGNTGTATNGDVSVTTAAANQIPGWAAAPAFTGADATSAANLGEVMRSIRWHAAPNPVTIDIAGLNAGTEYDLQLLFNEGGDRNRFWDIGVEGTLVVDNISSEGDGGTWTPNNSFAYQYQFQAGAAGTLSVVMQQNIGGDPPMPTDNNPILQAVIVHELTPPTAPTDILLSNADFPAGAPIGTAIGTLTSVDPNSGDTHDYELVAGEGDTDNARFDIDGDELVTNSDFSALGGTAFSVRVRSTDSSDLEFEKALQVTASDDNDADNLFDTWEMMFTDDLGDLTGLASGERAGTGDFDDDDSSDIEEFEIGTDPTDDDSDDDGSNDGDEATNGTDPNNPDSDDDDLNDGEEAILGTNPLNPDTDGDGLSDSEEVSDANGHVTDPTNADSDGDGADDKTEIDLGSDPNDPNDIPTGTTVIVGQVIEFTSPDDLLLDPATNVIAVDVNGGADVDVNGVTFFTDGQGGGSGTATNGDVSVTTTANNQIPGWAVAPQFTADDPASATNLAEVMRSIRWNGAPNPVTIDIEGLIPGALYNVQLLFDEGADRNRYWDIAVEDELVVDNISSEGLETAHAWTPENSAAYIADFEAPDDGILNIVMQQNIGGNPALPTDNNPILQAVIVHLAVPPTPFLITELDYNPATGISTVTWNSTPGRLYAVDFSPDMSANSWIELDDGVESEGEQTSFTDFEPRLGPRGYYRVRSF